MKQTIHEDNEKKSIEALRKNYPNAATREEALEQWLHDLPDGK